MPGGLAALLDDIAVLAKLAAASVDDVVEAASGAGGAELAAALRAFVAAHPPLAPVFVSRLLHQLRLGRGALPALEGWIAAEGVTAEHATTQATQRMALTQVMMANSITSLRGISVVDWAALRARWAST